MHHGITLHPYPSLEILKDFEEDLGSRQVDALDPGHHPPEGQGLHLVCTGARSARSLRAQQVAYLLTDMLLRCWMCPFSKEPHCQSLNSEPSSIKKLMGMGGWVCGREEGGTER